MAVDLDELLPAIYAADRLDEPRAAPGRPARGSRYHREPLTDGLVVVYLEDGGRGARILREAEVAALHLAERELRARTVENLRRRLGTVEQLGGPDVLMIAAGGTYEASLLLVDRFWNPETLPVAGDYVVALPGRDMLLVTGSDFPLGIARLRQIARESLPLSKEPVTAELLVRRDGRWSVLPAWIPNRPVEPPRAGLLGLLGKLFSTPEPDAR